ncbi:MAG: ABC transporter permease subunit [Paludisphaera borealis]|uniref:ABC transporter permease subunit/CPBP intramembrane protease n=1 Tax=Paludisphaera borealis TaxID=1387353 RepID=UPI00283DA2E4|nr:ABC transporter permease subunit/CPBP intramembrane protease [Paludisphaera borealis]MDR3618708.1 ABC transporter permease subunit [Paludisphaera borealis]
MRWSNLLTIFRREVLDQLRDRRTLFMIFIFPILLYPIIGAGVLQFAAALQEKPRIVVIVGAEHLPKEPALLNEKGDGFNPALFDSPAEAQRLLVQQESETGPWGKPVYREQAVRSGEGAAVMVIPTDLPEQFRQKNDVAIPIHYKSVDEPSQITYLRLREVLDRWKRGIVEVRRQEDRLPAGYAQPIEVKALDAATAQEVGGSVWGRIFPFLLVMMSLTGAFYPAVDLCAGEKERGTMETLLISPASRAEIVVGKFLCVLLASVTTAVLNLASMGLTGLQMAQRATSFGGVPARHAASALAPPTLQSTFWMIILLIPLAAFFSAVCVALAVLARSMKEGQYYMTPLYLVCLPLIFLTLAPGIELNLFYSIVPVTGVALLLRALIVGDYATAVRFFLPVLVPTVVYAWIALRWAIDQFQSEEVLFRESERFNLGHWFRHLFRDREPTPTGAQALLCFSLILTASWFLLQYMAAQGIGISLAAVAAGQFLILIPPVIMAVMLTSAPGKTLRLAWPEPRYLGLAAVMFVALNPLVNELGWLVTWLFPLSSALKESLGKVMEHAPNVWVSVLVFALIPAVCEEVAFRGFVLSGLERHRRTRSAIFLSALMFGFLHVLLSLFQQLFNATLLGVFLGLLAVRSRSLLPGIVFHALNNGFAVVSGSWIAGLRSVGLADWIYRNPDEGLYHKFWVGIGVVVAAALFHYLWKLDRPDRVSRWPESESESTI